MKIKDKVEQAVNKIYQELGQVTPSGLLNAAKPKASPIHDAFEWDNKKAGHQHRLWQARQWIRRVEIIIDDQPERLIHIPKIEQDGISGEGYYKPPSVIVNKPDEFQAAKMETLTKLNGAKAAYEVLKEAAKRKIEKPKTDFHKADLGFKQVEEALTT
jgi:hypothetical protein